MVELSAESACDLLARYMQLRRAQGTRPFVLLLGAGASVPSSYPTGLQFASSFLEASGAKYTALDDEGIRRLFDQYWGRAGQATIDAFVRQALPPVPHSRGYWFPATLAQQGYFRYVLTTNVDALLDQAFDTVDPWHQSHEVLSLPAARSPRHFVDRLGQAAQPIKVVKLHGDLRSGYFRFTSAETRRFENEVREAVRSLLAQDVIIVGHSLEDGDIVDCMSDVPHGVVRPEVFYVDPKGISEHAQNVLTRMIGDDRVIPQVIGAPVGDFEEFLTALYSRLTGIDVRSWYTFRSSLRGRDLQGFVWLRGRYWVRNGCLDFGEAGAESVLRVGMMAECSVCVTFQMLEARGRSDWFGLLLGATGPVWDQGHLFYVRQSGEVELRFPWGAIRVLGMVDPGTWTKLRLTVTKDELCWHAESGPVRVPWLAGEGNLHLWSHFSRSLVRDVELSPLPPRDS